MVARRLCGEELMLKADMTMRALFTLNVQYSSRPHAATAGSKVSSDYVTHRPLKRKDQQEHAASGPLT